MYQLFHRYAHRYDLHTPPGHYKHDHAFVLGEARRVAPGNCRLLDIGCGTGVFLEAALAAGIDGRGIDAAPEMIDVARRRLGDDRVRVERMQDLSDRKAFDIVCALSWTIHYCETVAELDDVLRRCRDALVGGGSLLLQVANDERMTCAVNIDREPGPAGEPDDTVFIHRFQPLHNAAHDALADYVYASSAHRELLTEQHELRFASPSLVSDALDRAQFQDIKLVNPASISPFLHAKVV